MQINIPELSLVVLIGPSGAGKSTFAAKFFLPTEIVSSDYCRAMICDDENDQSVTAEAFNLLHTILRKRLAEGYLTVVDATNVQRKARAPLVTIARKFHCLPVAVVFNLPEKICRERNETRRGRNVCPQIIHRQHSQMRKSINSLQREGFRRIFLINSEASADKAVIRRDPLKSNRKELSGPFDIIGDLHGCCDELEQLLLRMGYRPEKKTISDPVWGNLYYHHPQGRTAVFLGDIVDRGPRVLDTLRLVCNMVRTQNALCVPGNHDVRFLRKLQGKDVQITHGLDKSVAEYELLNEAIRGAFRAQTVEFLLNLVSHYVLDDGRLVVAHAGMKQSMQGRDSGKVHHFALYGDTSGKLDSFGLPERRNWAAEYHGRAVVVYGHTPVGTPEWLNRTVNIDTGCVFGGALTALRYPEKEFVSVPADHAYAQPPKPFLRS